MFCEKCGTDVKDSEICPNCGNEIQKDSFEEFVPFDAHKEEEGSFGLSLKKKKKRNKKKIGIISGICAAIVLIVALSVYLLYPIIERASNPKSYAAAALKNSTSDLKDGILQLLEGTDFEYIFSPQETTVDLKFDQVTAQKDSFLGELDGKKITANIKSSPKDQKKSSEITLESDGSKILTLQYWQDESEINFTIPELSNKIFVMDLESVYSSAESSDVREFTNILSSLDGAQVKNYMDQYSETIKAVIDDLIRGLDTAIDDFAYENTDRITYESENGNKKVSVYKVNITEEAIKKGATAFIENLFNDNALKQYMGMLTMFTGKSKQDLISSIESANLNINDIPLTVYVNDKKEAVRFLVDFNDIQAGSNLTIATDFLGKDNIYNYIVAEVSSDKDATMKLKYDHNGKNYNYNAHMVPKSGKDEFIDIDFQSQIDRKDRMIDTTINRLALQAKIEGDEFNMSLSGKGSLKMEDSVVFNNTKASDSMNVYDMTPEQQKEVLNEVNNNISKLKGKFSDQFINELYKGLRSALTTIN